MVLNNTWEVSRHEKIGIVRISSYEVSGHEKLDIGAEKLDIEAVQNLRLVSNVGLKYK